MAYHMSLYITGPPKRFLTNLALIRTFTCMDTQVSFHVRFADSVIGANITLKLGCDILLLKSFSNLDTFFKSQITYRTKKSLF